MTIRILCKNVVAISLILILLPAFVFAKGKGIEVSSKDTIHVVGHAHMDMNWLWTYSETMKMANDNLRQTVAFMDEFPDFTMIQSQASVYNFVEKVDPPLFELVKKYVKAGRPLVVPFFWRSDTSKVVSAKWPMWVGYLITSAIFHKCPRS